MQLIEHAEILIFAEIIAIFATVAPVLMLKNLGRLKKSIPLAAWGLPEFVLSLLCIVVTLLATIPLLASIVYALEPRYGLFPAGYLAMVPIMGNLVALHFITYGKAMLRPECDNER